MSEQVQQDQQFFDFERDILLRSPQLEPLKPILKPVESPTPLVPYDTSSDSSEPEVVEKLAASGRHKRRKGRTRRTRSDRVLMSYLGPNHIETASYAGKHALHSQSESEGGTDPDEEGGHSDLEHSPMSDQDISLQNAAQNVRTQPKSTPERPPRSSIRDDFPMVDPPRIVSGDRRVQTLLEAPDDTPRIQAKDRSSTNGRHEDGKWDVRPPPLDLGLSKLQTDITPGHEDSIVTSPALGKYAITARDADPDAIRLPALHKSPPRSSSAGSPENKQALPSIRTIPHLNDSMLNRPSPVQMTQTPMSYHSAYSGMSPPRYPSQHSSWRSSTHDSSISGSSEHTSAHSGTASTSSSSFLTLSPAASSYHSISTVAEQEPQPPHEDLPLAPEPGPGIVDPGDGSFMNGSYKCTFTGCNAVPFQTQYLLNSHMNVHSNQRPHFCPVPDCPRGVGGQGFKRKNEMIRHGLVHTSPGYICPFCADQQHKYPRPDNLQRHVRVHHVDRDRDDPLLRDVLNQRPEGGNRGRRRRMNS